MPLQLWTAGNRRPFGLGELNLVNDTRGHHRLGDAPTSHAIDACAHGYQESPRPAGTLKIGSLRFRFRKAIA